MSVIEIKLQLLRRAMSQYAKLDDDTWLRLASLCTARSIAKGDYLVRIGERTNSLFFVCSGLFRSFTVSADGKEYTKHFFPENSFPASIHALLKNETSRFALHAIEPSQVLAIDHTGYRKLLRESSSLKDYHISYLEKNWVLDKEPIEVALAIADARSRYQTFLADFPNLAPRIPLHYIASRIGITPTQLSRIRNPNT